MGSKFSIVAATDAQAKESGEFNRNGPRLDT